MISKVAVMGATGYTALELLKLLVRHPNAEIVALTSRNEAQPHVSEVHPELRGQLDIHLETLDLSHLIDSADVAEPANLSRGVVVHRFAPDNTTLGNDRRFELIERVVAEAAPHGLEEIIPSTMGEPLLYERFEDILKLCDRYGVRLNLTTNGTFPRLGAEAWARKIVPVTSDVKVSWNGATKATIP